MLSIFATRPEARTWAKGINVGREKHERAGVPQRPLKLNTQKRLAGGLWKWVLNHGEPFIINIANYGWNTSPDRRVSLPLDTITAGPRGGKHAAADVEVASFTSTLNHGGDEHRSADLRDPLNTVTGANDARAVVNVQLAPFTVPRYGEREGQAPRSGTIEQPLPTVTATDNGAQLAAVALNKHNLGVIGQAIDQPIGTVTGIDHHSILAVHLSEYHGVKGNEVRAQAVGEPLKTLDTQNRFGVAAAYLSHMYTSNTCGGQGDPRKPLKTITSGGQHANVCIIYLTPYYGSDSAILGHSPAEPMPTIVGKARFGLAGVEATRHWLLTPAGLKRAKRVANWARKMLGKKVERFMLEVRDEAGGVFKLLTVTIKGAVHLITDVLMRMLKPRELARAQGFDDSYIIDRLKMADGSEIRISKADQVKLIGNSVCPDVAEAIVFENVVKPGVLDDSAPALRPFDFAQGRQAVPA